VPDYCTGYGIYIFWFKKNTDVKVTIIYPSPMLGGVQGGCECDSLTWVTSHWNKYPWCYQSPLKALPRWIGIHVYSPFLKFGHRLPETCSLQISGNRTHLTRTDSRLTMNNVTQTQSRTGYCLMGLYDLQDVVDLTHHHLSSVSTPAWASMS